MSTESAVENPILQRGDDEGRRPRPRASLSSAFGSRWFQGSISFLAFLVVFAVYAIWLGGKFTSTDARALDVHQYTPVLLLGLAVLVTLIAGQFDLSVASMATLTCFLAVGLRIEGDWPFGLVIAACLAAGVVGGALNGFLVVRLGVNTFIATLGTGGIFLGLSSVYSHGTQIVATAGNGTLPSWFSGASSLGAVGTKFPAVVLWIALAGVAVSLFLSLRRRRPERFSAAGWQAATVVGLAAATAVLFALGLSDWVNAVSWTVGVLLIVATVVWVLLDHTTFGRNLRATGSNATAASLAGIDPGKETFKAFVLGGLLAALAGILLGASQGAASPNAAVSFLLPAFAAAFLSTVILSTGRFHVWGTLIGGVFLVWVGQGLIVGGIPFTWTEVVNGVVLIVAVGFSSYFRRSPVR